MHSSQFPALSGSFLTTCLVAIHSRPVASLPKGRGKKALFLSTVLPWLPLWEIHNKPSRYQEIT